MTDQPIYDEAEGCWVVGTNAIAGVTSVRVYDETLGHMGDGHPELKLMLPSLEHALHDTLQNPTKVVVSTTAPTTSYKYCSSNHTYADGDLVIPVKVIEGTSALAKTAYFTDRVSGQVVMDTSNG